MTFHYCRNILGIRADEEEESLKSAAENRSTSDYLSQKEYSADICTEVEKKVGCGTCFFMTILHY